MMEQLALAFAPSRRVRRLTAAQRALVAGAVGWAESVIANYTKRVGAFHLREDLIAAGHQGLVEAALAFDPGRGIPFSGFALQRVRGAAKDALDREIRAQRDDKGAPALLSVPPTQEHSVELKGVLRAVKALPKKTRQVVALIAAGNDIAATGVKLGIDRSSVWRRRRAGIATLRSNP